MAAEAIRRFGRSVRGSVRVRATVVAIAVVGLTLLVGAFALVVGLHAALAREVAAAATSHAEQAARLVDSGGDPAAVEAGDDDVVVQVLDASGEVLAATPNAAGQPAMATLAPGESSELDVPFDDDGFLVASAAASDGRTVLVGHSLSAVGESTSAVVNLLAIGLPVLLLVVGVTTWLVVGRALAPVDAIGADAEAISTTQPHRRLPRPVAGVEIVRLAGTMNRILDRLEQAHVRQRGLVAGASQELRSPIAAIRQHAEAALTSPGRSPNGELARAVRAESMRVQALVDDLLLLARANRQSLEPHLRPVDLADLVLAEARRLHDRGPVPVDVSRVSAAWIDGDLPALRRVLHNLGDNAARHARHQVVFVLAERDGWAELHVDDDGPGVPAAERSRVFEPFVRLDGAGAASAIGAASTVGTSSAAGAASAASAAGAAGAAGTAGATRTGRSGLGLTIVAEIVAAHGGTATIGVSPAGGARVTLRLPPPNG